MTLKVDGRLAATFATAFPAEQVVGFRGGRRLALVDNVVFHEDTGDALTPVSTVHESFAPIDFWRLGGLVFAALAALNGAILWLGRRRFGSRRLAFATLLANGVGAVLAGLLVGYQSFAAGRYPALDRGLQASEAQWKIATAEDVRAELRRRYASPPRATRILFLGTSQTWGAGAARSGDTFVEVACRLLDEKKVSAAYECLNAGISAVDSAYLLGAFESEWRRLGAKVVVIDLGNNDADGEQLAKNVERLIRLARESGAHPLVVLEPNSSEDPGADTEALARRHAAMRRIALAENVPVVDMQEFLTKSEDRGFLWWDSVHLTSFGQRLFAERLLPELAELLKRGAS